VDIPCRVAADRIAVLSPEAGEHTFVLAGRLEDRWTHLAGGIRPEGLASHRLEVAQIRFPEDYRSAGELLDRIAGDPRGGEADGCDAEARGCDAEAGGSGGGARGTDGEARRAG
jgi:hypothetical protein